MADRVSIAVQDFVAAPSAGEFLTPNGIVADPMERRRFIDYLASEDRIWKTRVERLGVRLDE